MTPGEVTLVIEQNRQTHAKIDALSAGLAVHVKDSAAVIALVEKHERYVQAVSKVAKWTGATAFAALLGYFGFK